MRSLRFVPLALVSLLAGGCILTSGQIQISFDLQNPIHVTNSALVKSEDIDLSTNSDYTDHKDNLKDLADFALLGQIKNNSTTVLQVEFWMTKTISNHTTVAQLTGDPTAVKIWGPFALDAGETKVIDWDASAGLFTPEGKAALIDEVKSQNGGDAAFTLYSVGAQGTFDFTIDGGVLVLVLDAGV